MEIKPFLFKSFSVLQDDRVFRVGTDGVLLGVLCNCINAENILEIGTGTGIISLMMAQRNSLAHVLAIDIDENASHLAQKNFECSIFKDRLTSRNIGIGDFYSPSKFDMIVSNPPYFEVNKSRKHFLARQQIALSFEDLARYSARFLSKNGLLSVILPSESEKQFVKLANSNYLYLRRKISIRGTKNGNVKRCVLEFSFLNTEVVEENMYLEETPREYSKIYLELTKDFHLFKKDKIF